jgi:hypothetical protein
MKEYLVIFKDGHTECLNYPDKKTMITDHFGTEEQFKSKVDMLKWTSLATEYVEDIRNGNKSAQIFSADVNPYGWRS